MKYIEIDFEKIELQTVDIYVNIVSNKILTYKSYQLVKKIIMNIVQIKMSEELINMNRELDQNCERTEYLKFQ